MGGGFRLSDSAVSTVVAPALMMVVSVAVVAGVAVGVMEEAEADGLVQTEVEIAEQGGIYVMRHNGGDAIAIADASISVYLSDDSLREYPMAWFSTELGNGFWDIGDRLPIPASLPPLPGDLSVKGVRITYHGIETPSILSEVGDTVFQTIVEVEPFLVCMEAGSAEQSEVLLDPADWSVAKDNGAMAGPCQAPCPGNHGTHGGHDKDGDGEDDHKNDQGKGHHKDGEDDHHGKGHDEHGQGHGKGHDKHHDAEGCIAICHKPGTPAEKTLYVPEAGWPGHAGHGDTLGPCDDSGDGETGKKDDGDA